MGLGRGWACIGIQLNYSKTIIGPGYKDRPSGAAWGRFGPSGADSIRPGYVGQVGPVRADRVGPVRAEWGWGGVGHALGFNKLL